MVKNKFKLVLLSLALFGCYSATHSSAEAAFLSDTGTIGFSVDSLKMSCDKLEFMYSVINLSRSPLRFASFKAPGEEYILDNGEILGSNPGSICFGLIGYDSCVGLTYSEITGDKKIQPGKSIRSWVHIKLPSHPSGTYFLRIRYDSRDLNSARQIWRGVLSAFRDSIKIDKCEVNH